MFAWALADRERFELSLRTAKIRTGQRMPDRAVPLRGLNLHSGAIDEGKGYELND